MNSNLNACLLAMVTAILCMVGTNADAQTLYVVDTFSDSNAPNPPRDGRISLREAIFASTTGQDYGDAPAGGNGTDVIKFDQSLAGGTIHLEGPIAVNWSDLEIKGPGAQHLTITSDLLNCFQVGGGYLYLEGITFANCYGTFGGAIFAFYGATVDIVGCQFERNIASSGGGALFVTSLAEVNIQSCAFIDNRSEEHGGAVYVDAGDVTAASTTFSGNSAEQDGGAVAGEWLSSWLRPTIALRNCTLTGNLAGTNLQNNSHGGGLAIIGAPPSWNSTGIMLTNTIAAENFAVTGSPPILFLNDDDISGRVGPSLVNNLVGVNSGMTGMVNGVDGNQVGTPGNVIDPRLLSRQLNGGQTLNHRPQSNSPAFNSGNNNSAVNVVPGLSFFDQRSRPRIRFGTVDIGAVER